MSIGDKLRDIFKSSNINQIDELGQEDFYKGKKPSKEDLEDLGIDEDDMDDVYAEGAEEDDDDEEYESGDEEEDEEETKEDEDEDEDEEEEEMKKSAIVSLIQDQSALEDTAIELIKQNKKQTKEIEFLKSKMERYLDEPVSPKRPLFQKSYIEEGFSSSEVKSKIKEGIEKGSLSTSDMLAWEGSRRLSHKAKNYIEKEEN